MTALDSASLPAEPAPLPPERRNILQTLLGVLFRPRSTFAYLRDHGGWSWLLPLALAAGLTLVSQAIALPIQRAQAEAAFAERQAQLESQGQAADMFVMGAPKDGASDKLETNAAGDFLFQYGLPLAGVLADWVLRGGLLLGLAWLLGGRPSPGSMLCLSGWSLLPNVARSLVVIVVMLAFQRVPAPGLAQSFAPEAPITTEGEGEKGGPQPGVRVMTAGPGGPQLSGPSFGDLFVGNLLGSLDVYTVWGLILLAIGVTVTARLSWLKGAFATLAYWGLSLVLAVLPPLIGFGLMGLLGGGGGGPVIKGP